MDEHYWSPEGRHRISRRNALRGVALGAAGLAGAALIGCSGGAGGRNGQTAAGGAATKATAPGAAAKPRFGGTLKTALLADPPGWSVFTAAGTTAAMNSFPYDKVVGVATGPGRASNSADVIPVLATGLPENPDPETYVFKIRQGVKFQNVAPVNGRPMTVEDVKYALDTLRAHASFRADYAPIASVTTPDAQTVVVKTSTPYAPLLSYLAVGNYGTWRVFPKEIIDSKITDNNAIGTGPYIRAEWVQGSKIVFKRNPDYWNKTDTAYVDEIQFLIMPEATTQAAAFLTKQLDILPDGLSCVQVEDVAKQAAKQAGPQIVRQPAPKALSGHAFNTTKPPFNDVRVRRAMSLVYNREAEKQAIYCGTAEATTLLPQKEGLKASEIPDMVAYTKYDVKQAKDLLAAAGFGNGFKTDIAWTPQYDAGWPSSASLQRYGSDLKQLGIEINPVSYEYARWIAEIYRPSFKWDGMMWSSTRYYGDPDPYVYYWLHPKGIANQSRVNDPALTALIEKQRTQVNQKERWETLREIQKMEAASLWYLRPPFGNSTIFTHPRVHDYVYHEAYEYTEFLNVWMDA